MEVRIGTEGFGYDNWLGDFYPKRLESKQYLDFYSKVFDTVELNSTFYEIPQESTVKKWAKVVPDDFVFSVKFPRAVTHSGNLVEAVSVTKVFLDMMSKLGSKLSVYLLQFPPNFGKNNQAQLIRFLASLPSKFRYSVELRNASWYQPDTLDDLMKNLKNLRIGLCVSDHPTVPRSVYVTTDFLYIRWQGDGRAFERADQTEERMKELKTWSEAIKRLPKGLNTVYCYMNDIFAGHAPAGANYLKECLGLPARYPEYFWPNNKRKSNGNGLGH